MKIDEETARAFWAQAFCAALAAVPADKWEHDRVTQQAAHHADLALVEFRKRRWSKQ